MRPSLAAVFAAVVVSGCAGTNAEPSPAATSEPTSRIASPQASPSVSPSPSPSAPAETHVFVLVMENAPLSVALGSPVIARLARTYVLATNYHAVASPSLPNYLALTSGSTWGVVDDGYHVLPPRGIGQQLTAAGISWRAYMEGLTTAGCKASPYPYALKHNPFAYYGGACPENVVALGALDADLAENTPRLVWITPGLCHDGHDCALADAAAWLDATVSKIIASAAWRERGVLFVVWDEGNPSDDLVPLIVAAPGLAPRQLSTRYDHYSLLAATEDLLGVGRLGAAASADPLSALLAGRGP